MRRYAVKEPRKRLFVQGNDTVIACIIPCKIRLKYMRASEEQRVLYVSLVNPVIDGSTQASLANQLMDARLLTN